LARLEDEALFYAILVNQFPPAALSIDHYPRDVLVSAALGHLLARVFDAVALGHSADGPTSEHPAEVGVHYDVDAEWMRIRWEF
jgi:hypothetical protein